jgi:hypothetical protein
VSRRPGLVLASALLAAAALTGCSEREAQRAADQAAERVETSARDAADEARKELGNVDWERYGDDLKRRLDTLADRADCSALRKELAKREANDTDLTRYIKAQLRRVC